MTIEVRIRTHLYSLRKKSVLHLILGGAAVHRCGNRTILNTALAAVGVAFARKRLCAQAVHVSRTSDIMKAPSVSEVRIRVSVRFYKARFCGWPRVRPAVNLQIASHNAGA